MNQPRCPEFSKFTFCKNFNSIEQIILTKFSQILLIILSWLEKFLFNCDHLVRFTIDLCQETVCLSECLFSGAFALRGRFQRRDAHVGGERGDSCAYVLRESGQSSLVVHVARVTHQLHESRWPAVRPAGTYQGEPPEVTVQPQQHQHRHAPTLPRQTLPWLRESFYISFLCAFPSRQRMSDQC